MIPRRPNATVSTVIVTALVVLWGLLRLYFFSETMLPLTFVLPLLICVWTRRPWQLWAMAAAFAVMISFKVFLQLPAGVLSQTGRWIFLGATLANILIGALVVHAIISLRSNLERKNETILAQNSELEAQAEELSQQNEEIRTQAEELAQQNEEIEAQSEEVARQNEDLVDLNERLRGREEILHGLLKASWNRDASEGVLDEICERGLRVVGPPATGFVLLELKGDSLTTISRSTGGNPVVIPDAWPLGGSIAGVVLGDKRTAYVDDIESDGAPSQPFGNGSGVRSVLATPVTLGGGRRGVLASVSSDVSHWTEEQFRMMEWLAAQCGLILEAARIQKALTEHTKALEVANQAKDNLLAMLSHELRTPLTPVLFASGHWENHAQLPEDVRNDFRMIRRNVSIQSRLIDDLLDLTRINRGKIDLEMQPLPVETLLRDTADVIAGDLATKGQSLRLDIDGVRNHSIDGDGARLQQVFWNLLKNAVKFSEPKSAIILRGASTGEAVRIEVIDQGCGIDPADAHRIFLPFEQVHPVRRSAISGGLGLGLTIAKAIVELHGGRIHASSEGRGRGAVFAVELPLSKTGDTTLAGDAGESSQPSGTGIRSVSILLVEDHEDTRLALGRLLRNSGHQVEHAGDAATALRLFQERHFDLLVSDLGLPDESGLSLVRKIRGLRPDLPAICLSGYGMEKDIAECHDAGFREHFTKPVHIGRLRAAISRLVEMPKSS